MANTARSDNLNHDSTASLRAAVKASPKPRAARTRRPKALALVPAEPASRINATLKTLLVGAAGGLVGGMIVRSAARRNQLTLGSTVRAVFAVATAWTAWSNRRHGNV